MIFCTSPAIVLFILNCLIKSVWSTNDESSFERNITTLINPMCPEDQCLNFTLVYVQQRGRTDVLHQLWSMENIPTLFYAKTGLNTELKIDWDGILTKNFSECISFSEEPQYFAVVLINKFIMYNDLNDTGKLPEDDSQDVISFNPTKMLWSLKLSNHTEENSSNSVVFHMTHYDGKPLDPSSNIEISFTAFGKRGRSSILPHLAFTENSTQVDFVFDHLDINKSIPNARLAVELLTATSEPHSNFFLNVSQSLDDEYTPGVFKLMEVHSTLNQHWIQWRPVCYTSTRRDIGDSTGLYQTDLKNATMTEDYLDNSLLKWLSLGLDVHSLPMKGFNVSFGIQGDGFYSASNYTAWTMVTGHGSPIGDKFSLMVILVMAIGLGLPGIVLIVGGVAIALRNHRNRKDDLLLSD